VYSADYVYKLQIVIAVPIRCRWRG